MLLRFLHFSYFCIRREETLSKTYLEIPASELVEFLKPFCDHYSCLVKTIMKSIK